MYRVVRIFSRNNITCTNGKSLCISHGRNLYSIEVNKDKTILENAAKEFQISKMSDWYNLTTKDIREKLGSTLLIKYNGSPFQLLSSVYPDYEWLPWKFRSSPQRFWTDINNQKKFMDWAAKELKIKEMSDWYKITSKDLNDLGGSSLLINYSGSPSKLLSAMYPEYEWLPWKFTVCPSNFWTIEANQRKFMNWAAKELKIKDLSDWYKDISNLGGASLLSLYNTSVFKLLSAMYPDYEWFPWKFQYCPKNFWTDVKNQRKFMDWAAKELKIKDTSDWYKVTLKDINDLGGASMLVLYSYSPSKLLSTIYPEYEWLPWKFHQLPVNGWDSEKDNAKRFVEMVSEKLKIQKPSDWYNIQNEGGHSILRFYQYSLYKILSAVYPDYHWLPWKFTVSRDNWTDTENAKAFLDSVAKSLKIKDMQDWYNIKTEQLIDLGAGCLLVKHHTLPNLLSHIYTDYSWEPKSFSQVVDIWNDEKCAKYYVERLQKYPDELSYLQRVIKNMRYKGTYVLLQLLNEKFPKFSWAVSSTAQGKKSQYVLKECLNALFTGEVFEEYKHPDIANLELDYFYPQYKLAFEYQGQQHYKNVAVFHRMESLDVRKRRDQVKTEVCKDIGITLIEVPYWWDRKESSLAATVYSQRPDLFKEKPQGEPIPLTPPATATRQTNTATRKTLMTATEWDMEAMDPTGWYMTEKYDGMRLYWNGSHCYSRQGEKVNVPEYITSKLPPVSLDGELWTQYGLYQEAVSLTRSSNEAKWSKAVFWVFDTPQMADKPLEARIEFLKQLNLPPFAKIVDFVKCNGKEHLKQYFSEILTKGGEGVMLREPGSVYKVGRSNSLRKYKPFFDTEVKVVKSNYPHGFTCKQANGKELFVKITENVEEAKQVKDGAVITVKHMGMNIHGTLQFPQFYRERVDVKWSDLNKAP